jgi:hypothetical protein
VLQNVELPVVDSHLMRLVKVDQSSIEGSVVCRGKGYPVGDMIRATLRSYGKNMGSIDKF